MSAGRGVTHSEFNPSPKEPLHFLQIWIQPRERGLTPSYSEWHPGAGHADTDLVLVISPDGRDGSATIHQDADIYRIRLKPGQTVTHRLNFGRGAWLQVAQGSLTFNDVGVTTGDGASTEEPGTLTFTAVEPTRGASSSGRGASPRRPSRRKPGRFGETPLPGCDEIVSWMRPCEPTEAILFDLK